MTDDARQEAVAEELELGDRALQAALTLRKADLFHDALSRLYFAAFHWSRALLASAAIEAKTHQGVQSLLALHFIRPGRLGAEQQHTLSRLETWRGKADYARGFVPTASLFDAEAPRAESFRTEVIRLLREDGLLGPP